MTRSRFKPIYVDLDDGAWYISSANTDSNLRVIRVVSNTPRNKWEVFHNRGTKKIFVQFLDNYTTERKPESIKFIDDVRILVEFAEPVVGELNLIFDRQDFITIPTQTPTPSVTPTVTPTPTFTATATVTPTVTATVTVTPTPSGA